MAAAPTARARSDIGYALGLTAAKIAAFVAVMLIVGKRVIPWILHYMAHTGSRELFRLSVLVIALGAAFGAAELFGVSFALGAFFAGMILSESKLSQQAATETLPLRDAFAVLFFVSVGMLFDPTILVREPVPVLITLLIILVGKSLAAFAIVRAFGYSNATALTISASLAQIGEFSFIFANLGVALMLLSEQGRDLMLAGAIISILLNPFLFSALDRLLHKRERAAAEAATAAAEAELATARAAPADQPDEPRGPGRSWPRRQRRQSGLGRTRRAVLRHRGRRGRGRRIESAGHRRSRRQRRRSGGDRSGKFGQGALPAGRHSQCLRRRSGGAASPHLNPGLRIIARAHSEAEILHLMKHGASHRGDGRARDRRRHGESRHLKEHAANEARSVQA